MKAERKLAITLFSAVLLSSCVSSVSDYCFYKARVAEEGVWFEKEPRELYKVGDTYYAKAKRGRVRGSQRGWPSHALFFEGSLRRFEWQPDDDAAEDVYVTMDTRYDTTPMPARDGHCTTTLPGRAERIAIPDGADRSCFRVGYKMGAEHTDWHQCYLYPMGCLLYIGVDIPCSIIGSTGMLMYMLLQEYGPF